MASLREVASAEMKDPKAPQQHKMPDFKACYLNVNGYDLVVDHTLHYTYKVPFAIQFERQPFCTRMGMMCCGCLPCCKETGPQDVMDFVDQNTGDQIRYHRYGRKLRVFHNGQYQGMLKHTWRCCNRMQTCLEDVKKAEVPLVDLFDDKDEKFAQLTRPGKGCCCICTPVFPMKCIDGSIAGIIPLNFFSCCSCTCECWPADSRCNGFPGALGCLNGAPTCGLPHGLIGCPCCDVMCCECCAKGPKKACGLTECPLLCFPNFCAFCACCCCCPKCEYDSLPIFTTFKYERGDLKNLKAGTTVGDYQVHYRGNAPYNSSWRHNEAEPYAVAMEVPKGGVYGAVTSALLAAKSYALGLAAPMLSEVDTRQGGPDYVPEIMTVRSEEVDNMMAALDANNRITTDVIFGDVEKKNVRGYTLLKIGYDNSWCSLCGIGICGGISSPPVYTRAKDRSEELIATGRDGGTRPTWSFEFFMEDPEKPIIHRKKDGPSLDKRFFDFFHDGTKEKSYLACQCIRFYRFPTDCTTRRATLCRVPCCKVDKKIVTVEDEDGKPVAPPNQFIMTPGRKVRPGFCEE
eukprot:TRINITY_DN4029_c0_g1_i1.p1 TRINITY_DN4029_c0_g1~~TRINITY_DN4029_c0_g1_i1.p1  ORF type:complete len:573 (+),score=96.84 TRINITY_DN4029_c0_g1_i1:75-1793(+)